MCFRYQGQFYCNISDLVIYLEVWNQDRLRLSVQGCPLVFTLQTVLKPPVVTNIYKRSVVVLITDLLQYLHCLKLHKKRIYLYETNILEILL